jgi:hypothetical protein
MIYIVKPFKEIGDLYGTKDSIVKPVVAIFFLVLIISSIQRTSNEIHALLWALWQELSCQILPRTIFIEK